MLASLGQGVAVLDKNVGVAGEVFGICESNQREVCNKDSALIDLGEDRRED
jgi:hypothetical protein